MSFRRTQTAVIRAGGPAGVSVGSYQRSVSAAPLPRLFEELEPSYRAALGYEAEKTIRADIRWTQENVGEVETGGWLFTAEQSPDYVLFATVPGSDSVASRSSIDLGFEQMEAAQRTYRDYEVAGCWHYHPGGDDIPSEADLRAFTHGARLGQGRWIGLIVTPSRSWRPDPEISAWVTFGPRSDLLITERLQLC
jgi:proteasome lid subunit RPN8/RPN11